MVRTIPFDSSRDDDIFYMHIVGRAQTLEQLHPTDPSTTSQGMDPIPRRHCLVAMRWRNIAMAAVAGELSSARSVLRWIVAMTVRL